MPTTNYPVFVNNSSHAFVRTPCPVKVVSSNANISPGVAGYFACIFQSGSQVGDTITIAYNGITLVFTCVAGAPTEPATYRAGASAAVAAYNFVNAVAALNDIDRDFIVTTVGGNIAWFQARLPGTQYNPDLTEATPDGRATFGFEPGTDPVRAANISVGLALYVEDVFNSGIFARVAQEYAVPDSAGACEFGLHTLLAPFLKLEPIPYKVSWPVPNVRLTSSRKRFKYRTWERYGDTPADGPMSNGPLNGYLASMGGIERVERNRFGQWYQAVLGGPHYFLTYRGRTALRTASVNEQHWLTWYNHYSRLAVGSGAEAINLEVRVHFTNGTTSAWTVRTVDTATPTGQFVAWATGWKQLNLQPLTNSTLTPTGWSVRVVGATSALVLSEEFYFTLVLPDYNELHILWVNSLGAWETLRTTGAWQRSTSGNYVERTRHLNADQLLAAQDPAVDSIPTYGQDKLQVSTGPVSGAQQRTHLDILHSEQYWLFDHDLQKLTPLRLLEASDLPVQQRGTAQEHLHNLALTFVEDDPTPARSVFTGPIPSSGGGGGVVIGQLQSDNIVL